MIEWLGIDPESMEINATIWPLCVLDENLEDLGLGETCFEGRLGWDSVGGGFVV